MTPPLQNPPNTREQPVASPDRVACAFARALLEGDSAAAARCFSPNGRLLTPDGTEVAGRAAVGAVLAQLVLSEVRLEIRHGRTIISPPVALAVQFWKRSTSGDVTGGLQQTTRATLVLVQERGGWTITIASPWG